jgi:probable rRNA maturation factor
MDKQVVSIKNAQRKIKLGEGFKAHIERCALVALSADGFFLPCEIDVTLVSDKKIQGVNREFRNINRSTDVLSFPLYEKGEIGQMKQTAAAKDDFLLLGDVLLSLETASRQAEEFGHSFLREAGFLTVHSVLHLLGYDHILEKDRAAMRKKEEEALAALGLER